LKIFVSFDVSDLIGLDDFFDVLIKEYILSGKDKLVLNERDGSLCGFFDV
jgi:hypothetical protein